MFFRERKPPGSGLRRLPLLPLRDLVVLPQAAVSFIVGREKSIVAMNEAQNGDKEIFLATQREPGTTDPNEDDVHTVGTIAAIIQIMRLPDHTQRVLVDGRRRGRITRFFPEASSTWVEVEDLPEHACSGPQVEALMRSARLLFEDYARYRANLAVDVVLSINSIDEPVRLGYALARHIASLKMADRQTLLEQDDPLERLNRLVAVLKAEQDQAGDRRSRPPRRPHALPPTPHEGSGSRDLEKDEFKNELQDLENRIHMAGLSAEALDRASRELRKLKQMSPMSAEAAVVRNYLDWILCLPWAPPEPSGIELGLARSILDKDHRGLQQVKTRILEYLAVMRLVSRIKGPILCLVGPPGVGKTSLAQSIAACAKRPFVRMALGGVRDEAEIRGHRRTYIGALPGRLIQGMRKAGATNPVFLLDEIDKLSSDFRGDPASALLEVLDPEQNHAFNDHYLDLDYDLSNVLFICTANSLDGIPVPLQDRLEIVRLSGYTAAEKLAISRYHLIPKQLLAHGLSPDDVRISQEAVERLIQQYTREAGVRNLEREIAALCRKVARRRVEKNATEAFRIDAARVEAMLGPPRYRPGQLQERDEVGFVNGLAWTATGGVVVPIEAVRLPGTGKLHLTGKLGDVFRESGQAAITYARSRAAALGMATDFWEKLDLHLHIPELWGVDGPSAGITLATAVISALTATPVLRSVGMTGEITLRGRVRPIGGLKEKLLAAQSAGLTTVLIPRDNEKDLKEVPRSVREELAIVLVEHMDEVLLHALARPFSALEGVVAEAPPA